MAGPALSRRSVPTLAAWFASTTWKSPGIAHCMVPGSPRTELSWRDPPPATSSNDLSEPRCAAALRQAQDGAYGRAQRVPHVRHRDVAGLPHLDSATMTFYLLRG